MVQVTFHSKIFSMGHDKYGDPKYAIYVPKSIHEKIKGLLEKEVIVIVILPDDEAVSYTHLTLPTIYSV